MEAAPLYEDVAEAPAGGKAWWLTASDGPRLRAAVWRPVATKDRRGTVFIFPGRTEYIEKYGHVAGHFTTDGFAVALPDWRGQGLSARALPERRLGHVAHFAEYQRDVAAFVALADHLDLPRPYHLVAHSMGGCIGLRALQEGLPVRAAAFSAPMWGIHLTRRNWPIAWVSALLAPLLGRGARLTPQTSLDHLLVTGPFEGNDLTSDRAMWAYMKTQTDRYPDLALGGPTLSWLRAALLETTRLSRLTPPDLPALVHVSAQDRVVSTAAARRMMARWPGGRIDILADTEHEIMMERPEVRQGFLDAATALFRANV